MPGYGTFKYNKQKYNQGGGADSFWSELDKKLDTKPRVKIEFVTVAGVATDITSYFSSGASVARMKDRAPDEIQAGDFDVVLFNHDNYFSEYKAGGLLYGIRYHGAKIRVWLGFELSDGTVTYQLQQIGLIDELVTDSEASLVTFRCRDVIQKVLDQALHIRPSSETPVPGASNIGDGVCSVVQTRPFSTVDEAWTLTCTVAGGDGTATFSVVGSITGSVGTATSGTEFSASGVGGVRFTVSKRTVNFAVGDTFTFSTRKYPEWTDKNPVKIIWSILTGRNWDTGTAEVWADFVLALDSTQSSLNTQLDYDSFVSAVAVAAALEPISGYVGYNQSALEMVSQLLLFFLGAIYTDSSGRIKIKAYLPEFFGGFREFADTKKISKLGYNRTVSEIWNRVSIEYKKANSWEFSDDDVILDGSFDEADATSESQYGSILFERKLPWRAGGVDTHVRDFATKLLSRYNQPPLNIQFTTGLDAVISGLGDIVEVTDEKYGFDGTRGEIVSLVKNFDAVPMNIDMIVRRDGDFSLDWAFLGSSADEGDGLSPQAANYDSATDADKSFAYLSQTGGEGSPPNYRMF